MDVRKIDKQGYNVILEFGKAYSGFDKKREAKTIVVFDESRKTVRSDTKRPLI